MGNNRNKLIFLAGFILFTLVSCWATSASLHLLLPTWPYIFCWLISLGVFILASFGSKLIVDSLNMGIYVNKRVLKLCLGGVIVILFWLLFSFPTNTHTLFYHNIAPSKINEDIAVTYDYLGQLARGTAVEEKIKAEQRAFDIDVSAKKANLINEILNENNPGFGPKSHKALSELNKVLGTDITPLSGNLANYSQRREACANLGKRIEDLRKLKLKEIGERIRTNDFPHIKGVAAETMKKLDIVKKDIAKGNLDVTDAEDLKAISDVVGEGYTVIRNYNDLVTFKSKQDKDLYTNPDSASRIARLTSVVDVWGDYIHGKYDGRGFISWILLSLLVDVAAFAFFDLAFSDKTED